MKMRKIISLLLALVMVCSIIPMAVFAEGETTTVTFDFSTLTDKNKDIASNAKSVFAGCASDASVLTAVTTTKIYSGNGDGGWKSQSSGFLKTGTSSVKGVINMTFTKKATKVEVVCHAWKTGAGDTIAVNGSTAQKAPNANSFDTLTFEIAASETVKIETNKRTFIQSITVTFAGSTAGGGEEETPCEHEYINEYDATCEKCANGDREVTLPEANSVITIEQAQKLYDAGITDTIYKVTGTIADDPAASSYNKGQYKFTVSDGTNTIQCYYTPVADGVVPAKGDAVTVTGKLAGYNGVVQFGSDALAVVTKNDPEQPEEPEVPDEPTVEYAEIADGTYLFVTDGKAMSNLAQDKNYGYPGYANVTVTDGVATGYANTNLFTITNVEGGFTIQDSYGRYYYLTGTHNSFNVSAEMPSEGHIWQAEVTEGGVLIVNVLKEKTLAYSAQYTSFGIYADQSSVMTLVAASAITEPDEPEVPENNDPEADSTLTIEEANALGATKDHNTYTEGKYYVTGIITEVYNDTYGNMYIIDEDGNVLHVYGTYDADGTNRYDAMEVKPVAGDTVTVYGVIGQYNGKPQMKNGWIVAHTPAETEDDDNTGDNTPETGDFGFIALVSLMAVSGTALVVLKKKEF